MKKIFLFAFSLLVVFSCVAPSSFAADSGPDTVQFSMNRPSSYREGNGMHFYVSMQYVYSGVRTTNLLDIYFPVAYSFSKVDFSALIVSGRVPIFSFYTSDSVSTSGIKVTIYDSSGSVVGINALDGFNVGISYQAARGAIFINTFGDSDKYSRTDPVYFYNDDYSQVGISSISLNQTTFNSGGDTWDNGARMASSNFIRYNTPPARVTSRFYSNLPMPVPSDFLAYFVIGNDDDMYIWSLSYMDDSLGRDGTYLFVDSSGNYQLSLFPYIEDEKEAAAGKSNLYSLIKYDAVSGKYDSMAVGETGTGGKIFNLGIKASEYPYIYVYGIDFFNMSDYPISLAPIVWNYNTDYSDIIEYLEKSLDSIGSDVSDILLWFKALMGDKSPFTTVTHNQYELYVMLLQRTLAMRDSFQNFKDAYGKDFSIALYELLMKTLGGDEEVKDIPLEDPKAVQDYIAAEQSVMKDYSGDLDSAFSSGSAVWSGNNAFSFIRGCIQTLVLDNTKLNALVLFALGFGLVVLIIGRRVTS